MAHDMDDKIKIRAFYESNDLSYAKVAEHFEQMGLEVSKKTIAYWGAKEGWQRNRFASMHEAVAQLLPPDVVANLTETMKQKVIDELAAGGGEVLSTEVIDTYTEAVTNEMIHQTLGRVGLVGKMAQNIRRAERIVQNSTSIGALATYQNMLVSTAGVLYGKRDGIMPDQTHPGDVDEAALREMSFEDLMRLSGRES